jgi:tetratricopeptide (TPR) repeat protein
MRQPVRPVSSSALGLAMICCWALPVTAAQTSTESMDALGKRIERAMEARDPAPMAGFIDGNALMARALRGLDTDVESKRGFSAGAVGSIANLPRAILAQLGADGSFVYRGVRETTEGPALLFRLVAASGGVNYHEYLLADAEAENLTASDIYVYMLGNWLTETFREGYIAMMVEQDRSLVDKLLRGRSHLVEDQRVIAAAGRHIAAGRNKTARELIASLPADVQTRKNVMLLKIQATADDDDAYAAALEEFGKLYAKDPAWLLVGIDAYLLRGKHDRSIELLGALQERVGGSDGYLGYLIGSTRLLQGDHAKARAAFESAIKMEPTETSAYYALIDVGLAEKDFSAVARDMDRVEKALDVEFSGLEEIEGFEEFVQSEAYQAWLEGRK